jgi:hypothetical protein
MPRFARRTFLSSLAAAVAAPRVLRAADKRKERFPIAFSTLGCPQWSWKAVLESAARERLHGPRAARHSG